MAHVQDVAAYILGGHGEMRATKLHRLCWYCYGYHLAWEERRLFPERFEAWASGPVCAWLWRRHEGRLVLQAGDCGGDPLHLDEGERESVDLVVGTYGGYPAAQLSAMSRGEHPWVLARARAGVLPVERSHERLADDEIAEFFGALSAAGAALT